MQLLRELTQDAPETRVVEIPTRVWSEALKAATNPADDDALQVLSDLQTGLAGAGKSLNVYITVIDVNTVLASTPTATE